MGGIADYSGSLVLEMPIAERTFAAVQVATDGVIRVVSEGEARAGVSAEFSLPLTDLNTSTPDALFPKNSAHHWAAYIVGTLWVLKHEHDVAFKNGARILVASNVPEGKGVSSSAAVEVAVMRAIINAFSLDVPQSEIPRLCQLAEHRVAGAPCGIMDQMTVHHGQPNQLFALLCRPASIQGHITMPADLGVWGLDSGIRHAVSGSDYGAVRVGAFMGLKVIETHTDLKLDGYLTTLSPSQLEQVAIKHLPDSLRGERFLAHYGELPDSATIIDPERTYAVLQPTKHPIYEHFRVGLFATLLSGGASNGPALGELMYQSHSSYSACGLGSDGTDLLVDLVRKSGPASGLFGAKITGGGSGGTVVVLGRSDAGAEIGRIATQYADQTGYTPYIFDPLQRQK